VGGGHIVPHGDVQALAGAVDSILAAPERWRSRAIAASARVGAAFGSASVARQLESLYRDVCAERVSSPREVLA